MCSETQLESKAKQPKQVVTTIHIFGFLILDRTR